MKKPKTEDFDPKERIRPEEVDLSGVPQIEKKPEQQRPDGEEKQESKKASTQASKLSDYQASKQEGLIERVRRVVKESGKEVSYVRLTPEEKRRVSDVVYSYKRQGTRTSENELLRIAVNSLLEDYEDNGKGSMLAKVIEALNA
jgi:hypothetical protein